MIDCAQTRHHNEQQTEPSLNCVTDTKQQNENSLFLGRLMGEEKWCVLQGNDHTRLMTFSHAMERV
jgi:hypothetical protein